MEVGAGQAGPAPATLAPMARTALISGAGVGGLTTALALAQRGWRVTVLERADAFGEVGAGIQQSPNAVRVHQALGTAEALRAMSFAPEAATIRDGRSGRVLVRVPLGTAAEARYGTPYLHCHRVDLHGVLAAACEAAGVVIRTGIDVTGYESGTLLTGDGVREADLIVGADGARSAIRAQMFPGAAPRFSGQTAWRALVPTDAVPPGTVPPDATSWIGNGGHVVTYLLRGGRLINVVAVREGRGWTEDGWSAPGDPHELRAAFAGWDGRIGAMLGAVKTCYLWGLFSHPPLPRWSDGTVALLGDAAHPMLPFMAQGAAMAVEDAWVLAEALDGGVGVSVSLRAYEARRRPRVARVHRLAEANAALFHRRGAWARAKMAAGSALPALPARAMDGVFGHDVTGGARGPGAC